MITITKICLRCGKPFSVERKFPHDYVSQYCSKHCRHQTTWINTKNKIKETGEFPSSDRRIARKYFKEEKSWKCEICGLSEWMGKEIPLIADHIDGNSENNKVLNYRLVCPNCDAQLPTFKGKNRGKGRIGRMKRYREGKSW